MKEPKRYSCGNGEGMFEDNKNGNWVEYSEHKAIVEELTEQLHKHDVMCEFHCERFDFGRDKKCEQQCRDCHWMETKSQRSEQLASYLQDVIGKKYSIYFEQQDIDGLIEVANGR